MRQKSAVKLQIGKIKCVKSLSEFRVQMIYVLYIYNLWCSSLVCWMAVNDLSSLCDFTICLCDIFTINLCILYVCANMIVLWLVVYIVHYSFSSHGMFVLSLNDRTISIIDWSLQSWSFHNSRYLCDACIDMCE